MLSNILEMYIEYKIIKRASVCVYVNKIMILELILL